VTALLLAASLVAPPGVLVDRVIAVVDKEVITHSELMREARVALIVREGEHTAYNDLSEELLAPFLDYLVNQVIIAGQARRLGSIEISDEEVEVAVETFVQRFRTRAAYEAFLRRFDISEAALRNILRRDLTNERYIAQRMRAWRVRTGDGDTGEAKYHEALQRWLEELRAGAELRILNENGELELQNASR
jgi:hypothetical protein